MSKHKNKLANPSSGFTIIELLIATLVFSVILLIATFGVIQIGRTYIKGYISSQTQNTTRSVIDEVTQAIQLSGPNAVTIYNGGNPDAANYYAFCVSTTRYTYQIGKELTATNPHVLFRDVVTPGTCTPNDGFKGSGTELLSYNERLTSLTVTQLPGCSSNSQCLYQINLGLLYGSDFVTTGGLGKSCLTYQYGGAFCGEATTSTTVEQRS